MAPKKFRHQHCFVTIGNVKQAELLTHIMHKPLPDQLRRGELFYENSLVRKVRTSASIRCSPKDYGPRTVVPPVHYRRKTVSSCTWRHNKPIVVILSWRRFLFWLR